MPTTETFVICERITRKQASSDVFGIKTGIVVSKFPGSAPVRLCARIRFSRLEEGAHSLHLTIVPPKEAADEQILHPLGTADIVLDEGQSFGIEQMDLHLEVPFPISGVYTFVLWIDEKVVADAMVVVRDRNTAHGRPARQTMLKSEPTSKGGFAKN